MEIGTGILISDLSKYWLSIKLAHFAIFLVLFRIPEIFPDFGTVCWLYFLDFAFFLFLFSLFDLSDQKQSRFYV